MPFFQAFRLFAGAIAMTVLLPMTPGAAGPERPAARPQGHWHWVQSHWVYVTARPVGMARPADMTPKPRPAHPGTEARANQRLPINADGA
jgi:hypothetical protein